MTGGGEAQWKYPQAGLQNQLNRKLIVSLQNTEQRMLIIKYTGLFLYVSFIYICVCVSVWVCVCVCVCGVCVVCVWCVCAQYMHT